MTQELKQPHEDVALINIRDDPYLDNLEVKKLIGQMTMALRRAYLYGGPNLFGVFQKMEDPPIGELVVVYDTFMRRKLDEDDLNMSVGYLVARREEWWQTDEEYDRLLKELDESPDYIRAIEPDAWYIQYGPDQVCRWVNCTVLRVKMDWRF